MCFLSQFVWSVCLPGMGMGFLFICLHPVLSVFFCHTPPLPVPFAFLCFAAILSRLRSSTLFYRLNNDSVILIFIHYF